MHPNWSGLTELRIITENMSEGNLKSAMSGFMNRATAYLQKRQEDALLQVGNKWKLLDQAIADREDRMAMSAWIPAEELGTPSAVVAPERLRYGRLRLEGDAGKAAKGMDVPLLLPTGVNAVMMNMGTEAEKVPCLFQNIMLRLLMSMRMNLVKVSVVDMDFGASFPVVSAITNPMFKSEIVYTQEEVTKLMSRLANEVSEANRNFLGRSADIEAYNSSAKNKAMPYHFVFIDDFPNGFTAQSIDGLVRLIENGNARKSGIKIFINYSEKNDAPREFDIRRFAANCAWVNRDMSGRIWFENIDFKFPAETSAEVEQETTERVGEYVDFINGIEEKQVAFSLDGWVEDLQKTDQVWKGNTIEGINVPVGISTKGETFFFKLGNDHGGNDFFALIAGRPGYGKTVLLHNIIVHAAMKYSPDELCLYLADFADGTGFNIFRDLPHAKTLMLSNNREYAFRMLMDLVNEAKNRANKFKKASRTTGKKITDLSSYRELTGDKLPRILLVMDEFHYLFLYNDSISYHAREELCNGIRQWRKFGINVILATQSISGVDFGDADKNITYRFALNLLDMDSKSVIRNDAAKTLTRKGQTIMNNTSDGRVSANEEFQCAYSTKYEDYVKYLADLYGQKYKKKHIPLICEDETEADIADNQDLMMMIAGKQSLDNKNDCCVYVGKPDLLRETHTRIRYRRQQNSNTLIIGEDFKTLVCDVMTQLVQLWIQSHSDSKFYIVDCFNDGDQYFGAFNEMNTLSDNFIVVNNKNVEECLNDVNESLTERKEKDIKTEERIFVVILNAQNCHELRPTGFKPPKSLELLKAILTDGAPLGIHCILHTLTYYSMFGSGKGCVFEPKDSYLFENIIFLKGADLEKTECRNLKTEAPEKEGQMVVVNAKLDGEPYEQCNSYSSFTCQKRDKNSTADFMTDFFDKNYYA